MDVSSADVVVIGGGLIGTAATYYLAKRGLAVALVESKGIAAGTSGACGDVLALQSKASGPKLALAAESLGIYRGLAEELGWDLELRNEGSTIVALDEAELEYLAGLVARLRAGGIPVDLLDAQAAREVQPGLGPRVIAASHCVLDCHVNPLRVSAGFARAAAGLGARVLTGTEVTGIEVRGGRVAAVATSGGRIATPVVVNAAGVWAPAIAHMVGVDLPVVPRRGQLLITAAMPPLVRGRIFGARYLMSKLSHAPGGYSSGVILGQQARGNFLIGSTREYVGFDTSATAGGIHDLVRQAVELLPALGDVRLLRAFAGLRPATPDGLPILRRWPAPEGFVVAAGHEGDGVCLAPVSGRIVAELVAGETRGT